MFECFFSTITWVAVLAACTLVIQLLRVLRGDCDLMLQYYEWLGKRPAKVLRGKVVWITGASSGIGEELAYVLAKNGAKLVLSARREKELQRVLERCKELSGDRNKEAHMVLPLDLLDTKCHPKAAVEVLQQLGRIDFLVNNAGRSQRGAAMETSLGVDQAALELNTIGTISITKAVLPHMLEQEEGCIVVTSSIAGKIGAPGSASYSASKHALQGFFETLRMEIADSGVSIVTVCPGKVDVQAARDRFGTILKKPSQSIESGGESKEKYLKQNGINVTRCAQLIAVAMANKLDEVWIALNPVLFFTYAAQYAPDIARWMGKRIGKKRLDNIKAGLENADASYFK